MKKPSITLLFFMAFLTIGLIGQVPEQFKIRIDSLNSMSKSFCKSNFDSAKYYAHEALLFSEDIDYKTGEINAIINLAEAEYFIGDLDSSLAFFARALDYSNKTEKYEKYAFYAYQGIGRVHYDKGEYSQALGFYNNAIDALPQSLLGDHLASILNMKGITYKRLGKLNKAQDSFIEALKFADEKEDKNMQAIILTNLGILNRNLKQYDKAIEYYDHALQYLLILKDSFGIGNIYQNKASLYSDLEEHGKSLRYNFLAKGIIEKNNCKNLNYATILNNIGLDYYMLHQPDSALLFFNKALNLSFDLNDKYGIADTKINLGIVYLEKGNLKKAQSLIAEGIDMADEIGAIDIAIGGYHYLVECALAVNDHKEAFKNQELFYALQDSVYNIEKVNAINDLQEKYQAEKKEQQIIILEKDKEIQEAEIKEKTQQRNWSIVFFTAMLIVSVIIYHYYKKAETAKLKIETLQREIHHRVKNNLSIIKRLVEVTEETINDTKGRKSLNELLSRIESMAQVHAQLHQKEDVTSIDFREYINTLCENISDSFNRDNIKLSLDIENNIDLNFSKAIPIGLIINELLTNAFKYAGIKNLSPMVSVQAIRENQKLRIMVSDNGRGFQNDINPDKVSSYGLKLVNGLTQQLNGTLILFNSEGANVEVVIDLLR